VTLGAAPQGWHLNDLTWRALEQPHSEWVHCLCSWPTQPLSIEFSCSHCRRKWRFPSGKQPSQHFNSSQKGRRATESKIKPKLAHLQFWEWVGPVARSQGSCDHCLFPPWDGKPECKGDTWIVLASIRRYLLSLRAQAQGPVKYTQKQKMESLCSYGPYDSRTSAQKNEQNSV
jgi:hypothetical protein